MDPQCQIAEDLREAFKKSVPLPKFGQINQFCTENAVRTNAAALTELVDCPTPETCEICIFARYYKQECILLQCSHRHYSNYCIHCCARRHIEIYTNPTAFTKAHCNPDPQSWADGFPAVYTESEQKDTSIRTVRERYTTPRSQAQDKRRNDWTQEQMMSLALAYYCTGKQLGATKPKVEEKQLKEAKKKFQLTGHRSRSPSPKRDLNNKPKQQSHPPRPETEIVIKSNPTPQNSKQQQETHMMTIEKPTAASVQAIKYSEDIDPETQSLAKQIIQNHTATPNRKTSPLTVETESQPKPKNQPNVTTRINMIRLCLCTDPHCSARQGQRMNEIIPEQQSQFPQISQTQTKDNKTIKTVQIQFEECTPFIWEQTAAYINCHGENTDLKALIDTGSCISIISYDKAIEITNKQDWKTSGGIWDKKVYIKAYSCTNNLLNLAGRITLPKFSFGNRKLLPTSASFWILHEASEQCIIAGQWLVAMNAVMSMQQRVLYYSLPQEPLSAGADKFVIQREAFTPQIQEANPAEGILEHLTNETSEIEKNYSPTTQRVINHISKLAPTIPANGHYSTTVGPAQPTDPTSIMVFANQLPAKIVIQQAQLMVHITNTTKEPIKLQNKPVIIQSMLPNNQTPNVQNINNEKQNLPAHLKLDNQEYEKTKNHINDWANEKHENGDWETYEAENNHEATRMLENLEKIQAQFDFKEHMHTKYLPIDQTKIKLTEYPAFGEKPFNEKTDKLTIFLCYILLAMGQTLNLQTLSKTELSHILQEFKGKTISALKDRIDQAFNSNNITKLYNKFPLEICHRLHLALTQAFDNINKLHKSKKKPPSKEYHTIEPAIMKNLVIKTQALSTLLFYVQNLTNDLAQSYGQHPYFYNNIIPKQQFKEIPVQLQCMPPKLLQQIQKMQPQPLKQNAQKIKVQSNRIKNRQEFEEFLLPTATVYQDRDYSFKQFKEEALHNYDELNQRAEEQVKPPVQPRIYKALSIDQLQSPEDIQEFVKYATSPSALHNFIKEQLPVSSDQVIPIGTFLKNLCRAKMVIYNTPEQAIQDYIPKQLRTQFDQFFTMFRDKQFIKASAELRLPDYPQMWVWGTPEEPSPLHDINTGLVLPKWLAFCATQMLSEDDIILQPEFETELALLAALIFTYGQFTISLHASHTGLFREDVFRAKSLLCPNTAVQNAKPSKNMGMTPCPDLDDKVEFMLRHGKAVRVHASPFLTSMTSIAKKRKTGKPLQFSADSPILQHLLSMSRPKQDQLSTQSQQIMKAREELAATHTQQRYNKTHKEHTDSNHSRANQPKSFKISASKQSKQRNHHRWTKSLRIEQIQQIYLNETEAYQNQIWDPPLTNNEKDYILSQLDQLNRVRQTPKDQHLKQVTWGSAIIVKYDPTDSPEPVQKSIHYPQYFKSLADHDLHQALENNQQVGNKSRHMVRPKDKYLKQKSDKTRYCVKFAFNNLQDKKKSKTTTNPEASRKQGLLANAHIFHQLIEDTSSLALQARIGPEHPQYDEVMKISIKEVHNGQAPLLRVQTIMNHLHTAASSQTYLQKAMETIGKHTIAVRHISDQNINTDAPENWQQCQKALSLVLGTVLLHSTENANMLASIGPTLNRFIRARRHLQAYKLKTKHQQIAQELIKGIWPEKLKEWNSTTIQEAKEQFNSWEKLFEEIAQFYKYPLVLVEGAIIKKSQRAYFDILKVAVYKASQYDETTDLFGYMATCFESHEVFSTRTSSTDFIKRLIQHAKEIQEESMTECQKFSIKDIFRLHKEHQKKTSNQDANRYSRVHFQHLEMDVYWKRDPFRTIINTRYNNHLCRESNTAFQSQHEIRQSLANSQFFSSFDLSSFYDQILACPTSSLINTVLYQGQELAMTIASMGSRNSCLWATAVVLSLLHHHTDELLLQPCYLPKPIDHIPMKKQNRQMTAEESYSMVPPLDLPACELIMKVINREQEQEREIAPQHIVELTPEQRKFIKAGNNHQLIHQVTLIDDFCISTAKLPNVMSHKEQVKKQLNVHLLCLKQLLMTTIELSRQPENSNRPFQPVKFKIEKAALFKNSVKFLNFIYIGNHQIINLEAFKGATNLDSLPTTGEALASRMSFFNYFMAYIPNLRYLCKDLEAFGQKFPNNKILPWNEHPELQQKYKNLAATSRALSGIAVLPNDLNKINFLVLSSDACNKTMAYSVGVSLHPDPSHEVGKEQHNTNLEQQTKLHLVRNYSCNLEENLLNLPIATKETMSAVKTLTMEEPLLKLVRQKKIYHTIDNSVLFGLLEQLQNSKELANHFMAHTQFRDWVLRLHQLTTLYNITVLLVPSKLCMADICTRSGETSQMKDRKEKNTTSEGAEQKTQKSTCTLCKVCKVACHNTTAHRNCLYNIRNSDHLNQHGPQLLEYKDKTEHQIVNEGQQINYVTTSTKFDPKKYKILHVEQLVAALDYSPQKSLDQNQTASADRTLHEEIQRLESIKDTEIESELHQIQEAINASTTPPESEKNSNQTKNKDDTTQLSSNSIQYKDSQANLIKNSNQPMAHTEHRLRTMPQKMFQINLYGKYKQQPTRSNPENTTILIFTGIRKSLRIASSIYANQLVGSHTEKLEKRALGVTFTENPGELSYLISCTPQDKLERKSAGSPEKFLPQLYEAMRQAAVKSPGKEIILDGNSVQKFYNLNADKIMTALILVSQSFRTYFPGIGLITWHRNQNSKYEKGRDQQLEIVLPIFKNKTKQSVIRLNLNDRGQCLDLIKLLKDSTWLGTQARVDIEFNDGTTEEYRRNNLATAQAIHIKQQPQYIRAIKPDIESETIKYTTLDDQSDEPVIDALLAKRKLRINQANDPYLMPILHQLQQAAQHQKILQSEDGKVQLKWKDDIVYGKLSQTHNEQAWRPVLPEAIILSEIMAAHMSQRCSSAEKAVEQIKRIFFHKRHATSHYDLLTMSQKILPCPRCIIRRPHSRAGNKLYAQNKSIVMSLKGLPCSTIAHDIIYITKPQSQEFQNKYLSIIVCYGCAFVHLKLIDKITGHNIATHVLELIQMTGNIPHVMITDSATTELRGIMAQCIQSLNVIQLQTNQNILEKTKSAIQYSRPRPQESNLETEDITLDPIEFPTVLLEELSEEQRNMLLQDFVESAPPLYPPLLSHNPVPYIDKQSYRSTSLGRLDFICGQIGVFLRKFITTQPELLQDENIDYLVQSFAFFHNFLHHDNRTQHPPAKLHLGALRFFNTKTFMERLNSQKTITNPEPIKKLQMMLQTAQEHREAQNNRNEHDQASYRQHKSIHGRLQKEKNVQDMFPVLSIIMLNTEIDHTKTSRKPSLHGPNLVLARVPNKRTLYLCNLIEGHIYKRSFRAVQKLLPSQEIFSTPNILDWFHFHPLQMIGRLASSESTQPELTTEQYTRILKNLGKVYEILAPVLPSAAQTQKVIEIQEATTNPGPEETSGEDQANKEIQKELDTMESSTANQRKTVQFQFQEDDTIEAIQDIVKDRKKRTNKEKEIGEANATPNAAYQHQETQGIDVTAPPAPDLPNPTLPDRTRNPDRPKRNRAIPSRYL